MNNTISNTLVAVDLAIMQRDLEALRIHAARLHETAMNLFDGGGPVSFEPRVEAAVMLAERTLEGIDNLPALYAAPAIDEVF